MITPEEQEKQPAGWRAALSGIALLGTFGVVFVYALRDFFADIHAGDPFAIVLAPLAVVVSAVMAAVCALSLLAVLETR
jgi:hypothetical protein